MNSLERIAAAAAFGTPDRVPVVAQVFGHAAVLAGVGVGDYVRDGALLARCQLAALRHYGYDAVFALMGRSRSPVARRTPLPGRWPGGINAAARIDLVAPLAGLIGSDLLAGLIATGLTDTPDAGLLIDFGTNSEIALWDGATLWTTSAAGGPAFEGSGLCCGLPAEPGAIDRLVFRDGHPVWHVIGGGPPRGLCGTGLVDLIAGLRRAGQLTERGRFAPAVPTAVGLGPGLTAQPGPALCQCIAETLDSGFLGFYGRSDPEPGTVICLPITQESRVTAVLAVGHHSGEPPSNERLNIDLAVAGMVGTAATRLASERELREHRRHLAALVEARTAELRSTNRQLQREIRERKSNQAILAARLRLIALAPSHGLTELLRATLDEVEALTGSTIGFYHFINADQRTIALQTWSTNTTQNMCQAQGEGQHYPLDQAGVWVDCVRQGRPIIHNDLDHFKQINDGAGHAVGDQALVRLARACRASLRETDLFARVGGDEFALLLPQTGPASAREVVERLRGALAACPGENPRAAPSLTISIGIASFPGLPGELDALLRSADQALY
ncbi:diguanylate cyclase [uncultured Lamprocystis sp.]|jgi:diguanylate cyclase (GGDEF)-like protein|uniref:diguanylate cyclase n=1 Tax=uncultured Lamprocystis sp. TaxID=543132 RepID=UPI0025DDC586|nr:diguanylate cyclase [uncultured Lamprocystis sp.]